MILQPHNHSSILPLDRLDDFIVERRPTPKGPQSVNVDVRTVVREFGACAARFAKAFAIIESFSKSAEIAPILDSPPRSNILQPVQSGLADRGRFHTMHLLTEYCDHELTGVA